MISKWMVSNFKSIRDKTELDFSPLTIFAGANSSGKSSFIQSILLVAQTLGHKDKSRSIVLNGYLSNLGQFNDVKSDCSKSDDPITIGFTYHPRADQWNSSFRPERTQFQRLSCELSFDADPTICNHELSQIQPRLLNSKLSCVSRNKGRADISFEYSKSKVAEDDSYFEIHKDLRKAFDYSVELDNFSMNEARKKYHPYRSLELVGCGLRHFLPEYIVFAEDGLSYDAYNLTRNLQANFRKKVWSLKNSEKKIIRVHLDPIHRNISLQIPQPVLNALYQVLEDSINPDSDFRYECPLILPIDSESGTITMRDWEIWLNTLPPKDFKKVNKVMKNWDERDLFERFHVAVEALMVDTLEARTDYNFDLPPALIENATHNLEEIFKSKVRYLGPLRNAPKTFFSYAHSADLDDVGLSGENTVSVLELHKSKEIGYIPSLEFKNHQFNNIRIFNTLEEAVVDWLQYLGVASSLNIQDMGRFGFRLKLELANSEGAHDLTHVGVGISQILPILVMCLIADEESVLIIEQPELHLHPKVQTLLGDFFISMTLCNKQCIIETHSEYLIDRLRFLIAAASSEAQLNNLTKIYFVEKLSVSSTFREVEIDEYGAISDWPRGFFDQSEQQATEILKAAMKKRKANLKKKDA